MQLPGRQVIKQRGGKKTKKIKVFSLKNTIKTVASIKCQSPSLRLGAGGTAEAGNCKDWNVFNLIKRKEKKKRAGPVCCRVTPL